MKPRVLFLCTGNSCRSQMAEGWARGLWGDCLDAFSAGTEPHGINRLAVSVMREAGIDISSHHSKHLDDLRDEHFDLVVTVCDHAATCPIPPSATRVVHMPFDDPPKLAREASSDEEALPFYQRVRDEIFRFIQELPELIPAASSSKSSG